MSTTTVFGWFFGVKIGRGFVSFGNCFGGLCCLLHFSDSLSGVPLDSSATFSDLLLAVA